jgi:hypothetical protein
MLARSRRIIVFFFIFCAFGLALFVFPLRAMDAYLWNMNHPASAQLVWRDKPLEVNGIAARVSRLNCPLRPKEIIEFYRGALLKDNWQPKDYFQAQNIIAFTKEERFFYVAVIDSGENNPCEVYLVDSPGDLAVCKTLADFFFKQEIAPDAPGKDIAGIPRFPLSRRRLSVFAPAQGAIIFYEAKATPEKIGRFFQESLGSRGWQRPQALALSWLKKSAPQLKEIQILYFQKGRDDLLIYVYPAPQEIGGGRSLITVSKNMLEELYP